MSKSEPSSSAKSQRPVRLDGQRSSALELRRTPLQARGLATFDRILTITAQLLDEMGAEAVTTNLIAKAAGINVATLYQYFPNKQAVLLSLFERQAQERRNACGGRIADVADSESWRLPIQDGIVALMAVRREQKGVVALRQAMRSDPVLKPYERTAAVNASRELSDALTRVAGLARTDADLVARCCVEALSALFDLWILESGGRDERVARQAQLLAEGYLSPYFDRPMARSPGLQRKRA